jgi:trimeric autotransporter adhesin
LLLAASVVLGLVMPATTNAANTSPAVTTLAGTGLRGFEDGPGKTASFSNPQAVAIDTFGVVYVADTGNNAVRKIDPSGSVTTLAGDGSRGFADGTREASFNAPNALTVDQTGNVFVSDAGNYAIRKIAPDGTVSTVAGTGKTPKNQNGVLEAAKNGTGTKAGTATFSKLQAIAVDKEGNLYVADNDAIRKIDKDANVTNYGPKQELDLPTGVAVDDAGNVFVLDPYKGVRRIDTSRNITTVLPFVLASSSPTSVYIGAEPKQLARDATGGIYLSNSARHTVDQISSAGSLTRVAGSVSKPGFANGTGGQSGSATFRSPGGMAIDTDGTIFVADAGNNSIRKIAGVKSVSAPIPSTSTTRPTAVKQAPQSGPSTRVGVLGSLNQPTGVAVDVKGNVYASNSRNAAVLLFPPSGRSSVFAGSTAAPAYDFETSTAKFYPTGLAVDNSGGVYLADAGYYKIRKVDQNGEQSIVAGNQKFGFVDGLGGPEGPASFNTPLGIAVDGGGNVYVADSENNAIRKIDRFLNVTTLAGTGIAGFENASGGRTGTATFNKPSGVAVERTTGAVFVADTGNNSIRKIDASGNVTTFAGNGARGNNNGTGGGSGSATFAGPSGLTIDAKGLLYVADTGNQAIRKIDTAGNVTTAIQWPNETDDNTPFAIAVDSNEILFVTTVGKGSSGLLRLDLSVPESQPTAANTAATPRATAITAGTKPSAKKPGKKARIVSRKIIKK